jgi:hypothetical protein
LMNVPSGRSVDLTCSRSPGSSLSVCMSWKMSVMVLHAAYCSFKRTQYGR